MDLSSRCVLSACCPSAVSCRIFSCPARRMWRDKRPLKTDTGSCVHTITGHKHMLLGSSTQGSTVCLRWITDLKQPFSSRSALAASIKPMPNGSPHCCRHKRVDLWHRARIFVSLFQFIFTLLLWERGRVREREKAQNHTVFIISWEKKAFHI